MGSKFFNDMAGLLGDEFMKRGATIPPCDWRTRDAFANMDIAGYNYGVYQGHAGVQRFAQGAARQVNATRPGGHPAQPAVKPGGVVGGGL